MGAIAMDGDVVTKLIPGGLSRLAHLSDEELLTNTRRLVGSSNQLFAALLEHLAEVEARGVHRTRRCASLYTYCIYELRFSEDAAFRRASAAKLVKEFPALFDAVANGELHLTGLLMIGPHLTFDNHVDVLARAKFRTKRELARLVRELQPLPKVPDHVAPLGPDLPKAPRNPGWEHWAAVLCGPYRELPPGERPSEWANDDLATTTAPETTTPVGHIAGLSEAPVELPPIVGPQAYELRFTTTEQHVRLIERARALLAREARIAQDGVGLGELHLRAMELLVASLEKSKFATAHDELRVAAVSEARPSTSSQALETARRHDGATPPPLPPRRSKHIPAAARREVFERDEGCCSYVDAAGRRCGEARFLELHHLSPFATGGAHVASNLALRCSAHNALAAEEDFGRERVLGKRHGARHESLRVAARNRLAETNRDDEDGSGSRSYPVNELPPG